MTSYTADRIRHTLPIIPFTFRDERRKPYTVRYEAVNAMLLNEFLKAHRKVEEQGATITQLKAELQANAARQQKQIEALTAGLQK